MTDATFSIEFSYPTSGDGSGWVELRVRDEPSGVYLCDIRLDPSQFLSMMRGGYVSGLAGSRSDDLSRVGRRMENSSYPVPRELVASTYRPREVAAKAVHDWALEQSWAPEWETFEPRSTNRGWVVVTRRWVA